MASRAAQRLTRLVTAGSHHLLAAVRNSPALPQPRCLLQSSPSAAARDLAWRTPVTAMKGAARGPRTERSEEHTSELQSLMRISYAVFCLKKKKKKKIENRRKTKK